MAFAPLILKGNLEVNGTDVSDQVTQFKFMGARSQIDIPETFGLRASFAAGSDTYQVQIDFLQDTDATALTQILWTALADDEGTIEVAGTMRAGVVSATNPQWTATAVVTSVGVGGEVNTVGVDSVTLPLTDRPTQVVTP